MTEYCKGLFLCSLKCFWDKTFCIEVGCVVLMRLETLCSLCHGSRNIIIIGVGHASRKIYLDTARRESKSAARQILKWMLILINWMLAVRKLPSWILLWAETRRRYFEKAVFKLMGLVGINYLQITNLLGDYIID